MKKKLNSLLRSITSLNEVKIFQAMANILNQSTQAIFAPETHGKKGIVEIFSNTLKQNIKREISDLLIITYLPKSAEVKINFLQAKYHKKQISNPFTFQADYFQWEMLKDKPNIIKNYNKYKFPTNILNFSHYHSITSFGVFYLDQNKIHDMLFCIPDLISPSTLPKLKTQAIRKFICNFNSSNVPVIFNLKPFETISCSSIDFFEQELLSGNIGAPIVKTSIANFIGNLLLSIPGLPQQDLVNEVTNLLLDSRLIIENIMPEQNPNILLLRAIE